MPSSRYGRAVVDDQDLQGLDPYDLMATEVARLDRFFAGLGDPEWQAPSRCAGWSVRDVLAHLAATEDYNRACLDGTVQQFLGEMGAKGATDIATANEIGIRELDNQTPQQVLDTWRTRAAENREDFRARDGGSVDSSVGAYPARLQAFHLAFELATHADDVAVPVTSDEATARNGWQVSFGRFALKELKPDIAIDGHDGRTHVRLGDVDVDLADEQFVQAVAARLPEDSGLDDEAVAALSATP
jgi:uncharacterized protein (TIGR03083 family)